MHGIILAAAIAASDGDLVGSCAYPQPECPVSLTRGADYTFHMPEGQGGEVQLLDPSGQVVVDAQAPTDGNDDVEFRAEAGGAYRIRLGDAVASVQVFTDCRGDAGTACGMARTVRGATTGTYDVDTYRIRLRGGSWHAYIFDRGYGSVTCGDRSWRNHKGEIDFRPPSTGECFLSISRAQGPYRLAVR